MFNKKIIKIAEISQIHYKMLAAESI